MPRSTSRALSPAGLVLLAGVVLLALTVRYADVLASPVMATEDPYTHLVFTREHMERGHFGDSFHMGTTLYPPGMHGFLGIFWSISNVDLYEFMRLGAPWWGALAAIGMFLLANRFGGLAAGATAGVLTALMHEHVLRTNIFVPTAMDLALVPFYLWAVMEALEPDEPGARLAWVVVAVVVGLALTVSHPWIAPLTAGPLLMYAVGRSLVTGGRALSLRGLGLAAAVPLALVAFAAKTRWKQSQSGLGDIIESRSSDLIAETIVAVLNVYTLGTLVLGGAAVALLALRGRRVAAQWVATAGLAILVAINVPMLAAYPPALVDYGVQLGAAAIWLGILGFVTLPLWLDNRVAQMGAALAVVTFPLTAVNFFNSPYLPHRTVVYLAVAVALLGGGLAALVARQIAVPDGSPVLAGRPARGARPWWRPARVRLPNVAMSGLVAVALAGLMMGPAATAEAEGWYRYYEAEEYEGFRAAADIMASDPRAIVLSGDWRPNMMLKSFSPNLDQVWYSEEWFTMEGARGDWNTRAKQSNLQLYVVVERYEVERFGQQHWTTGLPVVWQCSCGTMAIYKVTW